MGAPVKEGRGGRDKREFRSGVGNRDTVVDPLVARNGVKAEKLQANPLCSPPVAALPQHVDKRYGHGVSLLPQAGFRLHTEVDEDREAFPRQGEDVIDFPIGTGSRHVVGQGFGELVRASDASSGAPDYAVSPDLELDRELIARKILERLSELGLSNEGGATVGSDFLANLVATTAKSLSGMTRRAKLEALNTVDDPDDFRRKAHREEQEFLIIKRANRQGVVSIDHHSNDEDGFGTSKLGRGGFALTVPDAPTEEQAAVDMSSAKDTIYLPIEPDQYLDAKRELTARLLKKYLESFGFFEEGATITPQELQGLVLTAAKIVHGIDPVILTQLQEEGGIINNRHILADELNKLEERWGETLFDADEEDKAALAELQGEIANTELDSYVDELFEEHADLVRRAFVDSDLDPDAAEAAWNQLSKRFGLAEVVDHALGIQDEETGAAGRYDFDEAMTTQAAEAGRDVEAWLAANRRADTGGIVDPVIVDFDAASTVWFPDGIPGGDLEAAFRATDDALAARDAEVRDTPALGPEWSYLQPERDYREAVAADATSAALAGHEAPDLEDELNYGDLHTTATDILGRAKDFLKRSPKFKKALEKAGLAETYWDETVSTDIGARNPAVPLVVPIEVGGIRYDMLYHVFYTNVEYGEMLNIAQVTPTPLAGVPFAERDVIIGVNKDGFDPYHTQVDYRLYLHTSYPRTIGKNTPTTVDNVRQFLSEAGIVKDE